MLFSFYFSCREKIGQPWKKPVKPVAKKSVVQIQLTKKPTKSIMKVSSGRTVVEKPQPVPVWKTAEETPSKEAQPAETPVKETKYADDTPIKETKFADDTPYTETASYIA
jgi:hypothetical protein